MSSPLSAHPLSYSSFPAMEGITALQNRGLVRNNTGEEQSGSEKAAGSSWGDFTQPLTVQTYRDCTCLGPLMSNNSI